MQAQRLNLCLPVRLTLIAMGVSTVKVTNAVNGELNRLTVVKAEAKLGAGSAKTPKNKAHRFTVTETQSVKYEGKLTLPLLFDAWHSKVEAANKLAPFDSIGIPKCFVEWLGKFKADAETATADTEANALAGAGDATETAPAEAAAQ